jgi:hypothetical protein
MGEWLHTISSTCFTQSRYTSSQLRHVPLIQNHQHNLSKQEHLPHFSCKAMQVTSTTDFPAWNRTPNLIHHFFSIAVQVPAITGCKAIPPQHERHRRLRRILPTHPFSAQCTAQLSPLARSRDRSDAAARGGEARGKHTLANHPPLSPPTESPNLLMFASKCVQFSFASNLPLSCPSHRVCLTCLLPVILLLFY